jgi:Helicase conserved C-terminal domain
MSDYPDLEDPNFQFLIAERLEFRNLRNVDGLYHHQEFVRRFMSPYTPYKSLILYHSLGSGKSIACISVAVDHFLHDKKRCIVVTKGNSGTENFIKQIKMYHDMSSCKDEWNTSLFIFKHYISLSNQINNMADDDIKNMFSNKIIILDEVHNVRYLRKVVEHSVYGSILKVLQLCSNVKIIMATATPMTDNPEQIKSLLGICNYFREDKTSMNGIISYNAVVHDRPKAVMIGTDDYIPNLRIYTSNMVGHQKIYYEKENSDKPPEDIYRRLTHISLFCFDDGICGREVTDVKMNKTVVTTIITSMSTKHIREIKYAHYSIKQEYAHMLSGGNLRNSSSKYNSVVELIQQAEGKVFIFLEEVKGSGLLLLASILEQHGFSLYNGEDVQNVSPGPRYTICVGSIDICPNNNDRLDGFNSTINKDGNYVQILLGSRVIGESITLRHVRHFYCLTPHWNDSTINQAIGRVIRNGSHNELEAEKRYVNIYIHASLFPENPKQSVDIIKLQKSKDKEININKVEDTMRDISVDRFCLIEDRDISIKYVTMYAIAYLHNSINIIRSALYPILDNIGDDYIDIDELTMELNIHPIICKEAVSRFIFENESFVLSNGETYFLRTYNNYIFRVTDPSLSFILMPKYKHEKRVEQLTESLTKLTISDNNITIFRYMPIKQKIAFIEQCISENQLNTLTYINSLFASIDGIIYHLLLYRDVEKSYTSSNPVPRNPLGKTRMFKDGVWTTVATAGIELIIFSKYKHMLDQTLLSLDKKYGIYGIISVLDGDMRLRLRNMEDKDKSKSDSRFVRRGRNMKSIRKDYLLDILYRLIGTNPSHDMSITEIVDSIDLKLIQLQHYIII